MRKFGLVFWMAIASIALGFANAWEFDDFSVSGRSIFAHSLQSKHIAKQQTPMHKAIFTQRGYIQFLRWELPVPEIEEFTFCLWVKSTNLTYSHTIFSYSKDEKERLISSWISPFGRSVHLEIGGVEIMAHPTNLEEHRWYHICQSWENQISRYALWINGHKEVEGYAAQLIGHVIPSKGDLVVGQEYTDFDKGFEAGIEGAVVGFNLLLTSAFERSKNFPLPQRPRAQYLAPQISFFENRVPELLRLDRGTKPTPHLGPGTLPDLQFRKIRQNVPRLVPNSGPSLRPRILNERREGIFDSTLREYFGGREPFGTDFQKRVARGTSRSRRGTRRTKRRDGRIPLGLLLVDLTYSRCEIGRGSPFIGGSKMIISWTRTPVKVVGGTIIKNAKSNCGDF